MNKLDDAPLLSIAITSYSRVSELERCLKSIDVTSRKDIEIIISEDCSPKKHEIEKLVKEIKIHSIYKIIFNSNKTNLGYDKNIKKLIDLSIGKYILFITDDDKFSKYSLDKVINFLKEKEPAFLLTSFCHIKSNKLGRKYNYTHTIAAGVKNINRYIYDSILVSGLIFKKNLIPEYNTEKFNKLIYTQVYIFCSILLLNDGKYLDVNLIDCVEDGENAYGISKSNVNQKLADRSKPISNLEFNKGLIKIIRIFDKDYKTNLHDSFSKEYSLRSWSGLSQSKKISQQEMKLYFKELKNLDISFSFFPKLYFNFLTIFGYRFSEMLFFIPKFMIRVLRK